MRRDLRSLPVLTIDDVSTKEVDDGLSAALLPGGGIRVWVHVADPTRHVALGERQQLQAAAAAAARGLRVEQRDDLAVLPMLPPPLAACPSHLT